MRTRNVHYSQRQRPPIGRSVIMEAGTDPVLGDVGGAQISFGSIAGVDQGDDHQQQPRQQDPPPQQENVPQQHQNTQYDFDFNNFPLLELDGENHNNSKANESHSPKSDNSEFPSLHLNSSDEELLTSIENAALNPLDNEPEPFIRQSIPAYTQGTLDVASILAGGLGSHSRNNSNTNVANNKEDDDCPDAIGRGADGSFEYWDDDDENRPQPQQEHNVDGPTEVSIMDPLEDLDFDEEDLNPEDFKDLDEDSELLGTMYKHVIEDGNPDKSTKDLLSRTKRGKNESEYIRKIKNTMKRVWKTIQDYGGPVLQPLLEMVPANYAGKHVKDRRFYNVLGGEKNHLKHEILNQLFTLLVNKWHCLSGERKGLILQTDVFNFCMKLVSYDFEKKGILYNYKKDFNEEGQFHGAAITLWEEQRKKEPKFGTRSGANRAPDDFLAKVCTALKDGVIDLDDPEHLLMMAIICHGYYCGLRGQKEHYELSMEHIRFGVFSHKHGPELSGLNWGGIFIPIHKTQKLKLGHTTLDRDVPKVLIYSEDPYSQLCPWMIIKKYLSKCHPDAKNFYARPARCNEKVRFSEEAGREVWYCPAAPGCPTYNFGKNMITKKVKACATLLNCTVEEIDAFSGHALRALCITELIEAGVPSVEIAQHVRHASLNPQKRYAQETQTRADNRVMALQTSRKRGIDNLETPRQQPDVENRVENPYKKKIPFGPVPPPPGVSPGKWERFQKFENMERASRPEYTQQSVASDNRMPVAHPGTYQQQPGYMQVPPPAPQYIQAPVQPVQQWYPVNPVQPPQYPPNPMVYHQPAPTYWQGSGNINGNGHGQYNMMGNIQGQYNGYQAPQNQRTRFADNVDIINNIRNSSNNVRTRSDPPSDPPSRRLTQEI